MAFYTELVLNCEFDVDVPPEVIHSLKCLLEEVGNSSQQCVNNENLSFGLLNTNRYGSLSSESVLRYDPPGRMYYLSVHAHIKDNHDEIDRFLSWIARYSKRDGFVGYKFIDAILEMPSLIFFENGGAFLAETALAKKVEITKKP